jgi:hypothetical protein
LVTHFLVSSLISPRRRGLPQRLLSKAFEQHPCVRQITGQSAGTGQPTQRPAEQQPIKTTDHSDDIRRVPVYKSLRGVAPVRMKDRSSSLYLTGQLFLLLTVG